MKVIGFFNNKGGVGKTSLVYHLAWMYSLHGLRTLVVDYDPQANLTSMLLNDEQISDLYNHDDESNPALVSHSLQPILDGEGDLKPFVPLVMSHNLWLLPGDLGLSAFEDKAAESWSKTAAGDDIAAFRQITALYRLFYHAAQTCKADIVMIDVGPNLGALNRAALIGTDAVVIPMAPDLFSLQGLRNLGPVLKKWQSQWEKRVREFEENKSEQIARIPYPTRSMHPVGYVIMQHGIRKDRPVRAFERWMKKIPGEYRHSVLKEELRAIAASDNEYCLGQLKSYNSLMPLAMEAHKPMFLLNHNDGVSGAHVKAVQVIYNDFSMLAARIAKAVGVEYPARDSSA